MEVESVGLVLEQKVPMLRRHPYGFWALLFVLAVIGTVLLAQDVPNRRAYLGVCLTMCAGFITVPLALRIAHGIFHRWAREVDEYVLTDDKKALLRWFSEEMRFFEGSKSMCFAGLGLGALGVASFHFDGYFDDVSILAAFFGFAITFCSAFLAGVGLYAMCSGSRAVWILGSLPDVRVRVDKTNYGVLRTGVTLAKCWFVIGLVWCIYTLSALFGQQDFALNKWLTSFSVWILAAPTFPLIFGSFFICQIPLHERMVDYKRGELRRMDALLEKHKLDEIDDLTPERQALIEFLQRQRAEIMTLPEWPFGGKALFGLSASSITAVFPLLFGASAPDVMRSLSGLW